MRGSNDPSWRKPITGIAACCARAASGHAADRVPRARRTASFRMSDSAEERQAEVAEGYGLPCLQRGSGRFRGPTRDLLVVVRRLKAPGLVRCWRLSQG